MLHNRGSEFFGYEVIVEHREKGFGKVVQKERFMSEGTVKWFNPRKGYGFIATEDGRDIFVHYASISGDGYKTLVEGDAVSFDIVEGEKGLRAENVVRAGKQSGAGRRERFIKLLFALGLRGGRKQVPFFSSSELPN